jgi:holo-[acyl-carrier protein] synthase
MIVGLGIDLVELDRVDRLLARWGPAFLARIMSEEEAAALPAGRPASAVAASVAVKEAASKAIGTGWSHGVRWRDVVVRHGDGAAPLVRLEARALLTARRLGSSGATEVRLEHRPGLVLATVRLLA